MEQIDLKTESNKIVWDKDCYTLVVIFVDNKKIHHQIKVQRKKDGLFFIFDLLIYLLLLNNSKALMMTLN